METRKTILYVEDEESDRINLVRALDKRGFAAIGAPDVATTRNIIKERGGEIDVMVLDIHLADNQFPLLTGIDLGVEARELMSVYPPEFLILSGYGKNSYYEQALKLDAGRYLIRSNVVLEDVIRHIRSLCLRRALSFKRPEIDKKIAGIVASSLNSTEAMSIFFREILTPEMKTCIGAPALLLLTDKNGTQNCGDADCLPVGYQEAYGKVQALTQMVVNNSDPFVFDKSKIGAPADEQTDAIYTRLEGAAFMPLFAIHGLRLSIGILKMTDPRTMPHEDPIKLAQIVSPYLGPAIIEHLQHIVTLLTESRTRRETLLLHTSRFCSSVGQEQLAILEAARGKNDTDSIKECFQKFKTLSNNLHVTGELLSTLSSETKQGWNEVTSHAAETIRDVWEEIAEQLDTKGVEIETPDTEFSLPMAKADLFLSALCVLQWMALRKDRTMTGIQNISVEYLEDGDFAQLIFTDKSRRLGQNLREKLFLPFTQANLIPPQPKDKDEPPHPGLYMPLFLAKMMVEVKYKGTLQDRTDDLKTDDGHRFVMCFPLPYQR